MILWVSSASQKLPWRAWDEPPEPMTTSWESTTRQLHHQNLKTGSVHGLMIYGKIMTFVPWLPGTPIDRGYVGISRGAASMFQGLTYDVFVPFCPFGPILQLVAKKNKKEREKCRFLKISQIENTSRCRVWWSRPDKLRQLPSFEEVDSAVKRLETQRLNLNCLGNGCNMKPLENPRGKTKNCMKVHHWTCDCNGNAMESTMWNPVEPIWASARICTAERTVSNLRDNLPYALPAAAPRSGFALLFQSPTGWARNRVQRKRQRIKGPDNPTCYQLLST